MHQVPHGIDHLVPFTLLLRMIRCAPEVLRSQSYNEKSDVYSFGVIMCVCSMSILPCQCLSLRRIDKHARACI